MKARAALVLTACLLVPIAACGSRARLTKARYQQQVTDITGRFTDTLQGIFSSPALQNPASLKTEADAIRTGADAIRKAADELDGLNPPPNAEQAHHTLVDGFRELANDMDGFADDAQAGNLSRIQAFNQAVSSTTLPSMAKIKQAIDALKALGYQIGSGVSSPSP